MGDRKMRYAKKYLVMFMITVWFSAMPGCIDFSQHGSSSDEDQCYSGTIGPFFGYTECVTEKTSDDPSCNIYLLLALRQIEKCNEEY